MNEKQDSNFSENWHHIWTVNDTKHYLYTDINIIYVTYYLHWAQVAAVFIISYFVIFFLCMVRNTVVCFIVMRNKHMHTVTNLFILNLVISDLLVGIFCMPLTLLDNIIAGWPFGSTMCKISGFVLGISVAASVFTLVAIAVDRFWCVVYPFKPKLTIKTAFVIIIIIWVLAIAIISPSAIMLHVQEEKCYRVRLNSQNKTIPVYWGQEDWPSKEMRKIYTTVLFANIYLAPLSLIVIIIHRGFEDAFHLQLCQKRAKPKEAYTLRAKNNVVINTTHQLALESTIQTPHEEICFRKSAENPKQEFMIEELGGATNNNEIKEELV
ncbi:neuropeptide FF receptor 2 [Pteropus vampyrus]|uniref:Neuropeptide FF receptor 2 n=1 Tax=Pteropus vampyrus TaxID=132908 RepID=A0A6P6CGW4_PTEVA|nr:neuropeptide FF receptor 2 [Pteropus vampyrus]